MSDCDFSAYGPALFDLPYPRSQTPMSLALISDPHLSTRGHGTWKVFHRTEQRLQTAIRDINHLSIDQTLFLGDLTRIGERWNIERFDAIIDGLQTPFVAVPGNHDVPKSVTNHAATTIPEFGKKYTPGSLPFSVEIGDLRVIGLNSASMPDGSLRDSWGGGISTDQLDWLNAELDTGRVDILLMHHNLYGIPEHPKHEHWTDFRAQNADQLVEILSADSGTLVLTGHHHTPAVRRQNGVTEAIVPSTSSYIPSYVLLQIDQEGCSGWLVPLCESDGIVEARSFARKGTSHGKGIAQIVDDRLANLPLASSDR